MKCTSYEAVPHHAVSSGNKNTSIVYRSIGTGLSCITNSVCKSHLGSRNSVVSSSYSKLKLASTTVEAREG